MTGDRVFLAASLVVVAVSAAGLWQLRNPRSWLSLRVDEAVSLPQHAKRTGQHRDWFPMLGGDS